MQFKRHCNFTSEFASKERVLLNPSFWLFAKKLKRSVQMEVFKTSYEEESVGRYCAQVHVRRIEKINFTIYTLSSYISEGPLSMFLKLTQACMVSIDGSWAGGRRRGPPLSRTKMFSNSWFFSELLANSELAIPFHIVTYAKVLWRVRKYRERLLSNLRI